MQQVCLEVREALRSSTQRPVLLHHPKDQRATLEACQIYGSLSQCHSRHAFFKPCSDGVACRSEYEKLSLQECRNLLHERCKCVSAMSITDSACNKASRPIKKEAIANIAEATGDIWVDDTCAYGLEWLRTTPRSSLVCSADCVATFRFGLYVEEFINPKEVSDHLELEMSF